MGGESAIDLNLAVLTVLPALSLCTREASSWYFSVLRGWCMAIDLLRCRVDSDVHHPGAALLHLAILRNFLYPH